MRTPSTRNNSAARLTILPAIAATLFAVLLPATAPAATKGSGTASTLPSGSLIQLPGRKGCLVDQSSRPRSCGTARALKGPGPFMGSRAVVLSPDGRFVYVASSKSDAIAIFTRNRKTGTLTQAKGKAGCISTKASSGCASAAGLDGPNSLAMSPDGRNVYATARDSSSVTSFRRSSSTGALVQLSPKKGCISDAPLPRCTTGRALGGADVITVSPDGRNAYVGSFFGNAVAIFNRNRSSGALTQPADATGCFTEIATTNCTTGIALASPEGMAISHDGRNVYVATAVSNAVLSFKRNRSTGALAQPANGPGCISNAALTGCVTGSELGGANAVAVSPDDDNVYVTSLTSDSVTAFSRTSSSGRLTQLFGATSCIVWLGATGCAPGRATRAPEGVAVAPDGTSIYIAGYSSGAISMLNRDRSIGTMMQASGDPGCVSTRAIDKCSRGRALKGTSSIALSPDGRYVYSTASKSNAIDIFRRVPLRASK